MRCPHCNGRLKLVADVPLGSVDLMPDQPQTRPIFKPPASEEPKLATDAQRNKMLAHLIEVYGDQKLVKDYTEKAGILLPTETLLDWPLRYVPSVASQMELLESAITDFVDGDEARKPFVNPDPSKEQEKKSPTRPELKPQVPRDAKIGSWQTFKVPFGKNAGVPLGQLEDNSLAWYCREFEVTTEYNGKPKRAETIAKDREFRAALDAAMAELGIEDE